MRPTLGILATVLWTWLNAAAAAPISYRFDPDHAQVRFSYSMTFGTGEGRFSGVTGAAVIDDAALEKQRVEVNVDTRTLRSGDSVAQGVLRGADFFNIGKYPQMRFVSRSVRVKSPTSLDMTGDLTIKGITRPITLRATLQPPAAGGVRQMRAVTRIRRADFGMTAYAFLVGETVDIEIKAALTPAR